MSDRDEIIFLTNEEKERLLKCVDNANGVFKKRDKALIYLGYYCALRSSEIKNLKLEYFDKEKKEIYCQRGNNGKSNTIKIVDEKIYNYVCEYLEERLKSEFYSEYFFLTKSGKAITRHSLNYIFNGYCEEAGIPEEKRHFHVLRHTRAIDLLNMGLYLEELKWWMGLAAIKNAAVYTAILNVKVDEEGIYNRIKKGLLYAKEENRNKKESKFDAGTFDIQ